MICLDYVYGTLYCLSIVKSVNPEGINFCNSEKFKLLNEVEGVYWCLKCRLSVDTIFSSAYRFCLNSHNHYIFYVLKHDRVFHMN